MKKIVIFIVVFVITVISIISLNWVFFGPIDNSKATSIFVVPQDKTSFNLVDSLINQKLIKNKKAFEFVVTLLYKNLEVKSGGYNLSSSMNSWQIINKLRGKQDLLWVNISYCPRKEQVGEKLASILSWNSEKLNEWNNLFKNTDYFEGVYYPDSYLIPINESIEEVANRFISRFNEKANPLSDELLSKNIKWTTALKIASLIAREAAGSEDMNLISGIIWNRLNQGMRLQIDATMQYTLGKNEDGSWWGNIDLEQKQIDSPYNSYKYEGLPPTPICNPNIDFINASINPAETDCLFYLHDSNKVIHCAKTYKEHLKNIKLYL